MMTGEHIKYVEQKPDADTDAWIRKGINRQLYPNGDYVNMVCPKCGSWEWLPPTDPRAKAAILHKEEIKGE
jgi:predicted RNA-binding Zn-ribbon protein involved in translation (DUF1610 family)